MLRQLEEMGLQRGSPRRVWCCSPTSDTAILVTRYLDGLLAVPAPVHAAATRSAQAPGATVRRDGQPAGRAAPPRRVLGRLLAGQHAVLPGRPGAAGVAGRRRDQRGASRACPTGSASSICEILVENVAAGMIDLAARLDRPPELYATLIARGARAFGDALRAAVGDAAHRTGFRVRRPLPGGGHDPQAQRSRLRRRRGVPAAGQRRSRARLRLHVAVGDRRYHAAAPARPHRTGRRGRAGPHPARRSARLPGAAVPRGRPGRRRVAPRRGCG